MTKSTLTSRQEKFCECVAKNMTHSDAYRTSYSASNMLTKTINRKAAALMSKDIIRARVDELKERLAERELWTREDSVKTLISVMQDGRPNDIISAIKELNNMHGFNEPKKIDMSATIKANEAALVDAAKALELSMKQKSQAPDG